MPEHEVQVFCTARSGSTLVRGILYDLLGPSVPPQTHDIDLLDCRLLVVVYRDFRDSAASLWRASVAEFDTDEDKRVATVKEAIAAAETIKGHTERLGNIQHDEDTTLWLRYEDFIGHEARLFLQLAAFVGIEYPVSAAQLLSIADKWSMENVRRIASQRDGWKDWDETYQIHGHHVYKGEVGCWRELFPPESHSVVEYILGDHLRRWGYLI